jgi:beta-lactamase regulating signal transducer with metallopeptidase domain
MPSLAPHSLFDAVFTADQFHRLGWVVVHSLWQAAAVAAVLAIALRLLPRQSAVAVQLRYLVATLALLSLPAACAVTYAIVSPPSAVPLVESSHADRAVSLGAGAAAAGHQAAINGPGAASAQSAKAQNVAARIGMISRPAVAILAPWLPLFAAVWLAGAVAAAVRLGIGWSLTRRLVATATPPADARWQARLDHWAGALGVTHGVRFLASARVDAPLVFGWFRPAVVWPLAALTGMPPDQIDAILAHELAHVRRHDVLVNLLQSCIEALFFHHPAAWWISAQVRAEREHCADDLAVRALAAARAGSRLSYAAALLSLEERRQQTLLALAADGGSLGDRVRRLAGVEPAAGHPARLAAAVLVVAAVVATAASVATTGRRVEAAPPAARPDGLPADTNQITSLTAEQAKSLVASFKGVSVEHKEKHRSFVPYKLRGALPLNRLTTLDADTARALLEYGKGPLLLDGLTTLDAETARALAGSKNWSGSLPALKNLSVDVARALAEFKGKWLSFDGLTTLDAETAAALAGFKGSHLLFDGLTKLDAPTARALAGFTTHPAKDGDGSTQKFGGVWLILNGLETIDAETAKALTAFKGEHTYIYLKGLKSLSVDAARALGEYKGNELYLGLPKLTGDVAVAVAGSQCANLYLDKLTRLDAAAAASLAAYRGRVLDLGGLEGLSVDAARALAGFKGGALILVGPKLPPPDVLDAIAAFQGGYLWLSGPTTLSEPQARSLARFKGQLLAIDSLPTLTADTGRALAEFQGKNLMLDGLTAVDADTAKALAAFKGDVRLMGLKSLSLDTARFLYERRPQKALGLSFRGLTALDTPDAEQVARYLAGCEGKLMLPLLEKISPKALNALLAKQDIVLPPIDSLELIPEPDGSPTVKVVIPEGFEERQKKLMQP